MLPSLYCRRRHLEPPYLGGKINPDLWEERVYLPRAVLCGGDPHLPAASVPLVRSNTRACCAVKARVSDLARRLREPRSEALQLNKFFGVVITNPGVADPFLARLCVAPYCMRTPYGVLNTEAIRAFVPLLSSP